MALVKCAECEGQVSDKAKSCPHCGAPIALDSHEDQDGPTVVYNPKQDRFLTRNRGCLETLFWLFAAILVFVALRSCIGK